MTDRNRQFDEEIRRGFDLYASLAPEVATFAGIKTYDDRLPPATVEALESRRGVFATWAKNIGAFNPADLSADRRLDADVLQMIDALLAFEHDTLKPWQSNPDALGDLGNLFFVMTFAEYASEEERFEKIAARLEGIPKYLEETRARITRPEPRWCRIAADVAGSFPAMLDGLRDGAKENAPRLSARLDAAAARARDAAAAHETWCKARGAGTEFWAIGEEKFATLLEKKGIEMPARELEALGESYLKKFTDERARLAEQVAPGQGFDGAMKKLKSEHPASFEEAIGTVRSLVADSRAKVVADGIADIPEGELLTVLETPRFMATLTPFAAIFPATKFSRVQRGLYIVTRPSGPEGLKEVHMADLRNVVCHEGYPGHHLQLATANRKTSVVRSVDFGGFPSYGGTVFAIDLVEGWAHYCEELMKDHGFCDSPADRLVLVNDALWRAVRVILDVRLHAGRIGFDEAVAFLTTSTGMSIEGATSEVSRYTSSPTYQLSYLFGKHLLLEWRDEFRTAAGAGYRERDFHTAVLASGNVPVAMQRRNWRAARSIHATGA